MARWFIPLQGMANGPNKSLTVDTIIFTSTFQHLEVHFLTGWTVVKVKTFRKGGTFVEMTNGLENSSFHGDGLSLYLLCLSRTSVVNFFLVISIPAQQMLCKVVIPPAGWEVLSPPHGEKKK